MKELNASEFKAKCLAILDEVASTGESVTILKRGRPVAQLVPPIPRRLEYSQHELRDSVEVLGDIVGPVLASDAWEAAQDPAD